MMKYVSRRIFALTALYICIIFGIFALQFTNGNAFSLSIGSMNVSGTMEDETKNNTTILLPLHISVNGIDFFLDDQNSLMAYTSEKTAVKLKVTGIVKEASSFGITFTNNVSVTFNSEKRGSADIVTISAEIPANYQKIVFPYKLTRSANLEKKEALTLINFGKKQFLFTGGSGVVASIGSVPVTAVHLLPLQGRAPVVYYQTYIPAKGLSIEDLASVPAASENTYNRSVEQFAANALVSFKQSVSSGSLSEPLVASYIAEMGRIGMYRAAIESISESYRNSSLRTYRTLTFLNNLEKTYASLLTKEREDRLDLSKKLLENNPAVFEFPSLIPYIVDRGSSVLLKDVLRIASVIDISAITARQASGILEAMMDISLFAPAQQNTLIPLADSCERKLKASLVRINDDLYLSDDGKTINTLASLYSAPILLRFGSSVEGKSAWKFAGRLLVSSLVTFTSGNAILPAAFTLVPGSSSGEFSGIVAKTDVMLDPSAVYPIIMTGNNWYPHALSLSLQAGPGIWAWTSAQSVKITKLAENEMKITTSFTQGETHFMVLRGIKPFYRILVYGIDFRTDPRFESYNSSGYVYNEQTETLYLKMRHKSENEDVIIYFGQNPEQASSETEGETGISPEIEPVPIPGNNNPPQ